MELRHVRYILINVYWLFALTWGTSPTLYQYQHSNILCDLNYCLNNFTGKYVFEVLSNFYIAFIPKILAPIGLLIHMLVHRVPVFVYLRNRILICSYILHVGNSPKKYQSDLAIFFKEFVINGLWKIKVIRGSWGSWVVLVCEVEIKAPITGVSTLFTEWKNPAGWEKYDRLIFSGLHTSLY